MPALTARQLKQIKAGHEQGLSTRQIAAKVGCSTATVSRRVHQLGLKPRAERVAAAVEARQVDGRARQAAQSVRIAGIVDRILACVETTEIPPPRNPRGLLELAQAANVLLEAQHSIARNNPDDAAANARDIARDIRAGLRRLFPDVDQS